MTTFDKAYAKTRVHEGGFVNHPRDPGGATNKGVTQRVYDSYRRQIKQPTRSVKDISEGEAKAIYRAGYWDAVRADELPPGVSYCVFDAAINSGAAQAVKWLQRCVGAKDDGIVGNETLSMARDADRIELINAYCDMRLAFMKRLKHWDAFKNGWTRRVAEVRSQAVAWAKSGRDIEAQVEAPGKAEGPEKASATVKDLASNPAAVSALSGFLGSLGALASGAGPVQYALAGVFIIAALTGAWLVIRRTRA